MGGNRYCDPHQQAGSFVNPYSTKHVMSLPNGGLNFIL